MLQILAKNKQLNEGRKYLAHYDSDNEIDIGERYDYYSWDGKIKIGYRHEDDGRHPVAWGIEGKLIKYKQDEEGNIVFDEKDKPIIDKEFDNPGVHAENIPEPYKSGDAETTGIDEIIQGILADELDESINGPEEERRTFGRRKPNPKDYDWEEYDGKIHEEPDVLFAHHTQLKHGDKEVTLGKLDDYSARQLPWYDDPSKIDPKEMEEAKRVARQVTNANKGNEHEYEWRLRIYTNARTGRVSTGTYPWWMYTHEQALEELKKHCYHVWEKGDDFSDYNQYLYTGKSGHYETCKRCGEKREVIKWQNNYSGD